MSTEQEALRGVIGGVLRNASNYPPKVSARILGQDMGPLIDRTVDALISAGCRRQPAPPVLDTVEAMDALPAGSIVRYCTTTLATVSSSKTSEGWIVFGAQRPLSSGQLLDEAAELEVIVVFVPEVS
ncbi:hypothetical protein [Cryobacterium cryoconiti]|uniref:Uncharacterized protein n=1 Tax=Cryobacterium cryoconiti TaxID=1259239 RepID=A0A4Y8JWE8_9MICO|nr:hypothetical protein [Cryobacterium cryoconiti]TFD27469.1 hypothetical protein E3T49_13070 [Cryobacterium cryoconiti]